MVPWLLIMKPAMPSQRSTVSSEAVNASGPNGWLVGALACCVIVNCSVLWSPVSRSSDHYADVIASASVRNASIVVINNVRESTRRYS